MNTISNGNKCYEENKAEYREMESDLGMRRYFRWVGQKRHISTEGVDHQDTRQREELAERPSGRNKLSLL